MSATVIRTEKLHKRYGATVAVQSLNLCVEQGALFGLLGPNGAGKTTTFGMLCGWLSPTAGVATVLDTPARQNYRLAGRVAAMPQDAAFPRQVSVAAMLTHWGRLSGKSPLAAAKDTARVLEAVGLIEIANARGGELSHGMLKRVALAQALLGTPEVIFLDEPTAGLDPSASRQVKDLVKSLTPRATVVISSHNLSELQEICTHGAILDHGRLVRSGSLAELTRQSAELTIELRPQDVARPEPLQQALKDGRITCVAGQIHVSFASDRDPAEVIRCLLEQLLKEPVGILGIRRGQSLETAFLEATTSELGTKRG